MDLTFKPTMVRIWSLQCDFDLESKFTTICHAVNDTKSPLHAFPTRVSNPFMTQLYLSIESSKGGQTCGFDPSLRAFC